MQEHFYANVIHSCIAIFVILQGQHSCSAGKYELGQKENEYVTASEIIIMNESCMTEKPAGDETTAHSVPLKCGDDADNKGDQEEGEEDEKGMLQLEDEETHL